MRGTALVQDFDSLSAFAPRTGFISTLQQQRKLGWTTVLMCEEKSEVAEKALLMSGLAGAFRTLYFAADLDPEGMKKFGEFKEKDEWVVFVGDKAKDFRAARTHGISMVKVPEFAKPEDKFDFIVVHELLEAVILREFDAFR
ncbi:Uncharacterised protein [uncultured archaeon]|nr:Uncharacterised protein [uncultured archaeon]